MLRSKEKNESGRSMVEMLGVLAIIGVLSVGGIAGYTTAMNSHRANEAVNNATRLAVLLSSKRLLKSDATLSADELAGTNFEWVENADNIILSVDVPEAVKTKIAGMGLTVASLDTATQGKITFTFNNDLSERISGSQAGGSSGGSEQQQGQQQETQTPADPCAGYDSQCCSNGDITSTDVCNYGSGTMNGHCDKGQCVAMTCSSMNEYKDWGGVNISSLCLELECHLMESAMPEWWGCFDDGPSAEAACEDYGGDYEVTGSNASYCDD